MTSRTRNIFAPLAVLLVFTAAAVFFSALNKTPETFSSVASSGVASAPRTTDELIAAQEQVVRQRPDDANGYVLLADSYLQKFRESGDASLYSRADRVLTRARRLEPRNAAVYTGLGTLALGRHDFRGALRHGRRAVALAPDLVRPLGVVVDAQVELGRYDAAARTLQRMLDEKPNLASYSRASYFRELHGDLAGATRAMKLAVTAGGDAPENVAYVQTLLGQLHFARGRLGAAGLAYRKALYEYPEYPAAAAGLARVDAARGRLGAAIARFRAVVDQAPSADLLIELGELELAAGRTEQARIDFDAAREEQRTLAANGENTATEAALFAADHGSPARARRLARRAWANGPSIRSADAMGWALTSAGRPRAGLRWSRRALRLGSRDPLLLYHAGIAARGAGRTGEARSRLAEALSLNPRFSPLHAARAKRALQRLR
jgi:tetratricopeptide (TPR) repeat protein